METEILTDKSVKPNDEMIFSLLGDAELLWKQTFSYLHDHGSDVSVQWKYSECGKYWVCIALKKKNTLFRLRILKKNSFSMAFPFGDMSEPDVLKSTLPVAMKKDFIQTKRYNTTRYIVIDMENSMDFENAKKLIDLKTKN